MTPDIGELCAAGEAAFANDEFEEAEAWYELACQGKYLHPLPNRSTQHAALIANRFARYEQLRAMAYGRSVRRLPLPDRGRVTILQTCVGRERLLARTLASLGLSNSTAWPREFHIVRDLTRAGQAKTFFTVLRHAAETENFTALTLIEDDVVLAKNVLDYIATVRIDDDLGFISWFSLCTYDFPRVQPVLDCSPAREFMTNQAITFPAHTVRELLASDALKNWSEPHGADRLYSQVFPERKVAVHYPNLAQHVGGAESLTGNNSQGIRVSPSFIGEDADALDLI